MKQQKSQSFFFLNNLDIQVNPTIKYQPAFPGLF